MEILVFLGVVMGAITLALMTLARFAPEGEEIEGVGFVYKEKEGK